MSRPVDPEIKRQVLKMALDVDRPPLEQVARIFNVNTTTIKGWILEETGRKRVNPNESEVMAAIKGMLVYKRWGIARIAQELGEKPEYVAYWLAKEKKRRIAKGQCWLCEILCKEELCPQCRQDVEHGLKIDERYVDILNATILLGRRRVEKLLGGIIAQWQDEQRNHT